jgi:hypothetical protein
MVLQHLMAITNQVVNVFAKVSGVGQIAMFVHYYRTVVVLVTVLIQLLVVVTNVISNVQLIKSFLMMARAHASIHATLQPFNVRRTKSKNLIQCVNVLIVKFVKIMVC